MIILIDEKNVLRKALQVLVNVLIEPEMLYICYVIVIKQKLYIIVTVIKW